MSEKNLKLNVPVPVVYQAPNKETGATVIAEIYLPAGTKDIVNFPDLTLVERGASGVYVETFTPDDVGEWVVLIHKQNGDGQVVKRFSVGEHNLDSVGADVNGVQAGQAVIEGKIDTVINAVGALDTPPMVS